MTMTELQKKYYECGKKLSRQFPSYNFFDAAMISDVELPEDIDAPFLFAGFDGIAPEYVTAIRYGKIPASGYSTNWATGEREAGVSCLKIIRRSEDMNLVHPAYEIQGTRKIVVSGWYFGESGSDGEPILHHATQIRECV